MSAIVVLIEAVQTADVAHAQCALADPPAGDGRFGNESRRGPLLSESTDLLVRAERYRNKAEECRARATEATSSEGRLTYLQMAQSWDRMAEDAEKRHAALVRKNN
jgi:hypothetical protein